MNPSHVWAGAMSAPVVGIGIARTTHDNTHVGLLYRHSEDPLALHFLHLAWHKDLQDNAVDEQLKCPAMTQYLNTDILWVVPDVEIELLETAAILCRGIARSRPLVPYGFDYNDAGCF